MAPLFACRLLIRLEIRDLAQSSQSSGCSGAMVKTGRVDCILRSVSLNL
jgi:hypothetical protein